MCVRHGIEGVKVLGERVRRGLSLTKEEPFARRCYLGWGTRRWKRRGRGTDVREMNPPTPGAGMRAGGAFERNLQAHLVRRLVRRLAGPCVLLVGRRKRVDSGVDLAAAASGRAQILKSPIYSDLIYEYTRALIFQNLYSGTDAVPANMTRMGSKLMDEDGDIADAFFLVFFFLRAHVAPCAHTTVHAKRAHNNYNNLKCLYITMACF